MGRRWGLVFNARVCGLRWHWPRRRLRRPRAAQLLRGHRFLPISSEPKPARCFRNPQPAQHMHHSQNILRGEQEDRPGFRKQGLEYPCSLVHFVEK